MQIAGCCKKGTEGQEQHPGQEPDAQQAKQLTNFPENRVEGQKQDRDGAKEHGARQGVQEAKQLTSFFQNGKKGLEQD